MAFGKHHNSDERFRRLASRIEELRRKDERTHQHRIDVQRQRIEGAARLWQVCRDFADHLNTYVEQDRLELSPPDPPTEITEDSQVQLLLNVRGRIVLLEIRVPGTLVAAENFRKPYILEGEIRFFNQETLEEDRVEEHGIFFCPAEDHGGAWLYWNGRTYRSGRVDEDYLAGLLEQII